LSLFKGGNAISEFEEAFPFELKDKVIVKGLFGGEFKLKNMNFFEKLLNKGSKSRQVIAMDKLPGYY
jgi:hypothetical protein